MLYDPRSGVVVRRQNRRHRRETGPVRDVVFFSGIRVGFDARHHNIVAKGGDGGDGGGGGGRERRAHPAFLERVSSPFFYEGRIVFVL